MASATCSKRSNSSDNELPFAQDNVNASNCVPSSASSNTEPDHTANVSSSHSGHAKTRTSISRLSEGLEPMHLSDTTPLDDQLHEAASEVNNLGLHVKDIISTIQRLEGLGLQQHNIPLPKIIVLGEQSTGKSSVIESISGIKTPRSTGTCTRCPLFIKLESLSNPCAKWSARVTLRRSYNYDGKTGRGSERRFPGWILLSQPRIEEFMSTNDPDQLDEVIRRAQLAIISPWTDPKEFLKPSYDHTEGDQRCRFSPNVVCISITHPNLPALSFYDLPGIVGQAENHVEVKFVRDLVVEYVKDPEALILVTCAMDNDIANSTAGGIARQIKATDRCIGVLTKPDRISVSARQEKLQEIFVDKRFSFGHGYFVVRNLDQAQLKLRLSHQDARQQEKRFFEEEEPWATASPDLISRFGTLKLQAFLSSKLAEQITKKLPIIQKEIDARLQAVEEQLQQYPEPPTHNALRIIYDTVGGFTQNVRHEIEAEFPCTGWRNTWEALQRALFDSFVSLKPVMVVSGIRDKGVYAASLASGPGCSANDAIALCDSEDDEDADGNVSMSNTPNPETPTKKRKVDGGIPDPSPSKPHTPSKVSSKASSNDFGEKKTKFQLDNVAQHLDQTSKSKIPGLIEPRVIDALMLETLKHWHLPLGEFFNSLEQQLRNQLQVLFHKHFSKWEGTALYSAAWKSVIEMLELNLHQQRTTMANESLNDEKEGPYIFHSDIFNREKEAVLQLYRNARFKTRFNVYKQERQKRTGKVMTAPEEAKLQRDERLMAVINHEPYAVELDVTARVTAYYMFAARRFHDSICMRIESKFFKQLRTQLRDELENSLGIHDEIEGHRNAVRLLAEQSARETQRQELLAQISALRQGQQILVDLENKKYGDDDPSCVSSGVGSGSTSFGMHTPQPEEMDIEV